METLSDTNRYAGDSYARSLAQRYKNFEVPSPRFYSGVFGYKFLFYMNSPYKDWEAYKLGIIDENGDLIKRPTNSEEKKAYNYFVKLMISLKKQIEKTLPDQQQEKIKRLLFHVRETNWDLITLDILDVFHEEDNKEMNELLNEILNIDKSILELDESSFAGDIAGNGVVLGPDSKEQEDINRKKPQKLANIDEDEEEDVQDSNGNKLKFKDALKVFPPPPKK